jgi:acyl-coenzyme A synthetase/AMP-(fatty) acid ligase
MDTRTLMETLTRAPADSHLAFTEETSRGALHRMACDLATQMSATSQEKPVCVCGGDRALVAAALLAGLQTGIPLILPHSSSAATLASLQTEMPYAAAIVEATDKDTVLPTGVAVLQAHGETGGAGHAEGQAPLAPDRPWVYLFTGGSTGQPKTWIKTPTNLLAESHYLARRFGVTPADRILATAPPNHIYGLLYALLMPLLGGARVSAATPVFPHEILKNLAAGKATILVSLPVHYRSLRPHAYDDHSLRLAFSSAGPLDPADGQAFSTATGAPLYEIYGSTETGGIASRCRHRGETDLTPFEPVQVDVSEESAAVTSAFISPDLPRDDQGRFHLADRLETTPQGTLRLKGRSDGIVKVGGKRVDLEMVKETIKDQKGVSDAVVFSLAGEAGRETEIVAVVEGPAAAENLRERLQGELEAYALPRRIKVVAKIPMLATGKYDRRALQRLFK